MGHHVVSSNFDDSAVDVTEVLKTILKSYRKHKVTVKASKENIQSIFALFEDILSIASFDEISQSEFEDVFNELSSVLNKIS